MSLTYRAFGLAIRSPIALWPESLAVSGDGAVDVEVSVLGSHGVGADGFSLTSDDTATTIGGLGVLRVARGCVIDVHAEPGVHDSIIAGAVTGPGLAMLLQQRGFFALHGSSIQIGRRAVCIAGASGAGKSTIAMALRYRGHRLLSDGMTVLLSGDAGEMMVLPGPRVARLWPDAAEHLGISVADLPRVQPSHEKRVSTLEALGDPSPVVLARVLATSVGEPFGIAPIGAAAGVMQLVKNAFLVDWIDAASGPALLELSAGVATRAQVDRMLRGASLSDLDRVVGLLEALAR